MQNSPGRLYLPDFHPKQQFFYDSKGTEILWGGDTRGGKSAGTKLSLIRWCYLIPGLQCDIWRLREDDVISGYMEGRFGFPSLLREWIKHKWVTHNQTEIRFSNGSNIFLENCWTDAALSKAQGIPRHVRVLDEAGQIPERRIKWLKLWMTMSKEDKAEIPEQWRSQFPKLIYLMNRMGQSKNYFRRVFVKSRPKYEIEKVGAFYQQYITASVYDNPSEDAQDTIDRVSADTDSSMAKALLSEAGWDAQTGNYFEDWDEDKHVIKAFIVPEHWTRFRAFDYGSYEPWACTWWAYASEGMTIHRGTPNEKYIPRGALVCYREWYGCKAEHSVDEKDKNVTNKAPKNWSNLDMAKGIQERTEAQFRRQPTFTDSFPFNNLGGNVIANDFNYKDETGKEIGVKLEEGDTDRKNGWAQMRNRLIGEKLNANIPYSFPMMYFFEDCKYCRDYVPMIERNPSEKKSDWDAQESGEATHICDTIRLAAMTYKIMKEAPVMPEVQFQQAVKKTIQKPTMASIMRERGNNWL